MEPFSKRDEQRLLDAGRRFFSTAFPNPERVGCPGEETLKAIAFRRLDRQRAKEWDDHLSHCSPCFNEYMAFRTEALRTSRFRKVAAVAAVVVLAVAAWLVIRATRSGAPRPNQLETGNTNPIYQTNLLDLRQSSALRGAEPSVTGVPLTLPRARLALSIYLPTGSEPGDYDVQITEEPGKPLLTVHGVARLENHIAVMTLRLDLERLRPGLYLLGIRQVGTSWSFYPVLVKAGA